MILSNLNSLFSFTIKQFCEYISCLLIIKIDDLKLYIIYSFINMVFWKNVFFLINLHYLLTLLTFKYYYYFKILLDIGVLILRF